MDHNGDEDKTYVLMDRPDAEVIETAMGIDCKSSELATDDHPPSSSNPAILQMQSDSIHPSPATSIIESSYNVPLSLVRSFPSEATLVDSAVSPPPAKKRQLPNHRTHPIPVDMFAARLRQDSKLRNESWKQHLFHPQSGTTTQISTLLQNLATKGLGSDVAFHELAKYGDYELENFTFLQEIIPNLFLGR